MRVWQKIYFLTLLLFLVLLNIGLFMAAGFIFKYNLDAERRQAETESSFLVQNIVHDFSILERTGRYESETMQAVVRGYRSFYEGRNVEVSLTEEKDHQDCVVNTEVKHGGSEITIRIQRNLLTPYDGFGLSYQKRLVSFEALFKALKRMFAAISLGMSALLCILHYFLMRRILRPLVRLNEGVAQIAEGNYQQRISCTGKDELAELAANVNQMSEKISAQIGMLEEENARKQRLMDNLAHEIRTPLTSIYGYAEYLQRAKTGEEERLLNLSYIMDESRRLHKLAETMLSMRLYEKEELILRPVPIQRIKENVYKILEEKLKQKELELILDFSVEQLEGDEILLTCLFRNLLENAVYASREGGCIIWSGKNTKDGKMVFEIQDYGSGMEKETLKRITEPFYREDKARSRANGGAGLGLSIAALIVEKHRGTLSFISEKGRGTTAMVILQASNMSLKTL